jgi:hypothetical protein
MPTQVPASGLPLKGSTHSTGSLHFIFRGYSCLGFSGQVQKKQPKLWVDPFNGKLHGSAVSPFSSQTMFFPGATRCRGSQATESAVP